MAKITFADKITLAPQPDIAHENKCTADDLNEIKNSVNALYTPNDWTLIDNNIYYKRVGNVITIIRQARNNGGSYIQNEISLTGYDYTNITSSIPSAIRPNSRFAFPVFVHFTDNSFGTASCYGEIQTDGKLSIYNWGNTKTANRIAFCFTYIID